MRVTFILEPVPHQDSPHYPTRVFKGIPLEDAKEVMEGYGNPENEQILVYHGEGKEDHHAYAVKRERLVGIEVEPEQ